MNHFRDLLLSLLVAMVALSSCRKEEEIIPSSRVRVGVPGRPGKIKGFFLLNEANMGSNKATLDYYDYTTAFYTRNIYAERNPNVVKELGDVGNDLQIHGSRLYAVINVSHLIEVMDVRTAKHIGKISIPNCRYITFKDGFAYVSSYAGPVQIDPNARLGYVAKVDTATLQVVAECPVGYQPDELVISGDKLYVANSGGYRVPNYDKTISVIDLKTFTEVKKVDVAINLHRLELDNYGKIWVSSRGDYYKVPSKIFVFDPKTEKVTKTLDVSCSNMTLAGDSLFVYSTEWSYITGANTISYTVIDTKSQEVIDRNFIKDGTEKDIKIPYGIAVNREQGEFYVTDAKNYVTPGRLHCYDLKTGTR
ncbi:YncE family protein, partial [Porphyromonas sp.]|uniref:YncE family protein n=1 Tax=Porphyromonas sp. TaxID=1924944 RepID=UPI001CACFB72